ncbi:MAG: cysteine-rich CWC family protein [Candidatus Acidiferrales bacterium]
MNVLHLIRNLFRPARAAGPNPTCPACGEQFACGATLCGCWCAEAKLSEAARAALRERYSGCLCRDCLQRYATGATPGANP